MKEGCIREAWRYVLFVYYLKRRNLLTSFRKLSGLFGLDSFGLTTCDKEHRGLREERSSPA